MPNPMGNLAELSFEELKQVMYDRLQAHQPIGPFTDPRTGLRPFEWLSKEYERADTGLRDRMSLVLREFLPELTDLDRWGNQSRADLLDLIQDCGESLVDDIHRLIRRRTLFDIEPAMHAGLLKCLINLGHCATPEFWIEQSKLLGPKYGAVVLSGLVEHGLDVAGPFIPRLCTDTQAQQQIRLLIPILQDQFGTSAVARTFAATFHELPESARQAFGSDLGIVVPGNTPDGNKDGTLQEGIFVASTDIPWEIQEAVDNLSLLRKSKLGVEGILQPGMYLRVNTQYTELPEVEKMQSRLGDLLYTMIGHPEDYREPQHFDVVRYQDIATCNAVFYTFPFFMTERRRSLRTWGVLPYGRHRSFGVLVHETLLKELSRLTRQEQANGTMHGEEAEASWFIDVVNYLDRIQGEFFAIDYLCSEILPFMWREKGLAPAAAAFARVADPVRPTDIFGCKRLRSRIDAKKEDSERLAMVYDLAHRNQIEEAAPEGFIPFVVKHGLEIPVGIGFSLLMLPLLLSDRRWMQLWDEAVAILAPCHDSLLDCGITYDPTILRSPLVIGEAPSN